MKRNIIGIIAVLVLVLGGIFTASRLRAGGGGAGKTQYKLTKAEVGEVKKTVSATGTLKPWAVIDIKSRAGGAVLNMPVEAGDSVEKGQVLARIDPSDTQLSAGTAQADYDSAIARQRQSQRTYELQQEQSSTSIQQAEADLRSARANLAAARSRLTTARDQARTQPTLTAAQIAQAQAAYDQAIRQRRQLDATNPQQRAAAQAAYDQAVANRKNSQALVERQQSLIKKGFIAQQTLDTALTDLAVRDATVTSAKAKLDTIGDELSTAVEAADARVAQSKAALDNARAGRVDIRSRENSAMEAAAAVRQQEAQVKRAEVAVQTARDGRANIDIRRFDVASAQASIARAEATRKNARTILDQTVVRSPTDGVILQKYVEPGTIITSGLSFNSQGTSIVQIGDTSKMYVDVVVDETDIANVDEGQPVEVEVDAYPGVAFDGKVARIDPQAVVEQNVTNIHVRVEVDNSAPTFRLLKPGMNATCEFVIDKKENAVKVPTEAVREDDQGKFVEVGTGGQPAPPDPKTGAPADPGTLVDVVVKRVPVEAGIQGNDNTEIVSGLKGDEQVVTQTIEPEADQSGSPFGGGFGRPGGGGGGARRR